MRSRTAGKAPEPSQIEFERGRWDIERWAWVYLGIRMHPGQVRMAKASLRRNKTGWRALFLWIMVSAGNRAGKTLALSIIILHSCVYRHGMKPPDDWNDVEEVEHWGKMPYHWWHFAVEQGPAEQVYGELKSILKGEHAAQKRGCPWAKQVGGFEKIALISDENGTKDRGEYASIKLVDDMGGAEVHFRSTKAKALSAIGQNMHGLSFDEAGLEPNLQYLLEEVMHARRLGTGGQFIIISTPSAATSQEFEDLWITGDPEDPFRKPHRFAMTMSTEDNIGYGIDRDTYEDMIDGMPEDWINQNIHGRFIQAATVWFNSVSIDNAFDSDLPEHEDPRPGQVYIHVLDPGLKDKCWSLVFRVLSNGDLVGVAIERMQGKQTTKGIVRLGKRVHHEYEQKLDEKGQPKLWVKLRVAEEGKTVTANPEPGLATIETGVDTTALGGHMFRDLLQEDDEAKPEDGGLPGIPTKSIEFGGNSQVKRRLLSDSRTMLDEGRIRFPKGGYWEEVRKQHRNYKLLDRRIEQDLVMEVAMAAKLARQSARVHNAEAVTVDMRVGVSDSHKLDLNKERLGLRAGLAAKRRARRAAEAQALTRAPIDTYDRNDA